MIVPYKFRFLLGIDLCFTLFVFSKKAITATKRHLIWHDFCNELFNLYEYEYVSVIRKMGPNESLSRIGVFVGQSIKFLLKIHILCYGTARYCT